MPRHGAAGLARALRRVPAGTPGRDGGSVTVEAAVALASLMAVLMLCLAGIACLIAAVRVTDAAGEAARLAARGDDEAARAAVSQLAPAGSVLSLSGGDFVTAQVAAPPLGHLLPGIHVEATAVAAREPESAGP